MNIGADIVYQNDLYFDPADPANGSLYLCLPQGAPASAVEPFIESLRSAGLWSQAPYKSVPEAHKKMYAEQMQFIARAQFGDEKVAILAARFDHPKFPSNPARWQDWLAAMAKNSEE